MKTNPSAASRFALPCFVTVAFLTAPSLHAASAIWNGSPTDATWATGTNWSATPVPGTGDTATFDNAGGAVDMIDLGAGVTVNSVLFDTASAAAYTIGTSSAQNLTLDPSGSITMNASVAANQTFSANLVLGTNVANQTFSITNNSTTNSLNFGDIQKTFNQTTTINVSGAGTINADRIRKNTGATQVVTVNKSGSGTLNLNGTLDNRFVDLTMSAGLVVLNKTGATDQRAASSATVNGGTLQISGNQGDQINANLTVNGGIVDLNGRNEGLANLSGIGGTIYNTANATTSTITLTGTPSATYAGNIVDNAGGGQTGLIALTKNGTGVLTLSGTNSFTGGTTVNAGAVTYTNTSAKSGTTTVAAAGSVGLGVGGAGLFSSTDVDNLLANTLAGFTLDAASGVRVNTAAGDFTYSGNRTDARVLTKAGGNTLFLTGNNSAATGTTVVGANSGVLSINTTNALAGWNVNGRWSIANGSALVVGNGVTDGEVATILGTSNFGNSSNFGFDTSAGDRTYAANIGQIGGSNGGLFKIGANTLTLSGNNTFIGVNEIKAGTLKLGSATALGTTASITAVAANATLDLNGQTIANNLGNAVNNVSRSAFQDATSVLTNTSGTAAAVTGNINLSTGTSFSVNGTGAITLGTVTRATSATGGVFLTKAGAGTLTLGGAVDNSFLGLAVINGTVVLNKTTNAGSRATSDVFVNGGTLQLAGDQGDQIFGDLIVDGGVVDLNGRDEGLAIIAGAGGTIYNTANATTSTLTLTGAGAPTFAGVIADNAGGGQTGIVALTKTGTGTQTLSGNNTYTGDTTVTNGILSVTTPNFDDDSTVTLGSAAMLELPNAGIDLVGALVIGGIPQGDGLYTFGTGQLQVEGSNPYTTWAGSAVFDEDDNGDGVSNGLAWIIGAGSPTDNAALGLLPQPVQSGGNLTLTFTQVNPIAPNQLFVEYSRDLGITDPWHRVAVPADDMTVDGVIFNITPATPNSGVTLTIPVSKAAGGGKLFSRLVGVQN